jgi:hypothetical protein
MLQLREGWRKRTKEERRNKQRGKEQTGNAFSLSDVNRLFNDASVPRLARLVLVVDPEEVGIGELVLADLVLVLDCVWLLVARGVGKDEREAVLGKVL